MSNTTIPNRIRRLKDGWFEKPELYKYQKKTKDAQMFQCPKCGAAVQVKTKVWARSSRKGGFSIQVVAQCDVDKVVMNEVEL